ncbi:MAG: hypothetical protein IPI91_10855 [Flavobacteriales bacterium]|nr:hypothetical protein [Flavobacteriales bacterium]
MKPITYILLLLAAFLVLPTTAQTDLEVQLKKLEEQNSAFTLQQEKMVARLD